MTQRSLLITGCSSGIGLDSARTMAKRGWRVFATCRKEEDCKRLREEGLESFTLDYASSESVAEGAAKVLELTGGQLDGLFNNGAFAIPGLVEDLSRDALRHLFETNFFGQFELINALLPTMRQRDARIVNCSSVLGFAAMPFRGAYNSSKFAMEGLTDTLRRELDHLPVQIILIEPGPIKTKIRENSIPQFERWIDWENSSERGKYENELRPRLYDPQVKKDRYELPPSAVTEKLIHALESNRPNPRYYVTTPTRMAGVLNRILSTRMLDKVFLR